MPESDPRLRTGVISPMTYRQDLVGNWTFLTKLLKPENILHKWKEYPAQVDLERELGNIKANLETADIYFQAKIAAVALVEAIAADVGSISYDGSGVNSSLHDLLNGVGDKIDFHAKSLRPKNTTAADLDPTTKIVEKTLKGEALKYDVALAALQSRGDAPKFDIDRSPVGYLLYQHISLVQIGQLVTTAQATIGEVEKQEKAGTAVTPKHKKEAMGRFLEAASAITGPELISAIVKSMRDVAIEKKDGNRAENLDTLAAELDRGASEQRANVTKEAVSMPTISGFAGAELARRGSAGRFGITQPDFPGGQYTPPRS